MKKKSTTSRRTFLKWFGPYTFLAAAAAQCAAFFHFMMPNGLIKPPHLFKVGAPHSFSQGITFNENARVFIFRQDNAFFAMSAICTHLGCTVNKIAVGKGGDSKAGIVEFDCPCHGSKYDEQGINMTGPAPKPLQRYKLLRAADDGQLMVDLDEIVPRAFRLHL